MWPARLTLIHTTCAHAHTQDDDIKVWDMELRPGETAPLHTHEYSYVFTVLVRATVPSFVCMCVS